MDYGTSETPFEYKKNAYPLLMLPNLVEFQMTRLGDYPHSS